MRTSSRVGWTAAAVFALASAAWGGAGDLTWMDKPLNDGGWEWHGQSIHSFGRPPEGCGTKHPRAVVGQFKIDDRTVVVAIDAASADAARPDLVRFDFSGKLKFDDTSVLAMKQREKAAGADARQVLVFGPGLVRFERDGKVVVATVQGAYTRDGDDRWMYVSVRVAAQGRCRIGDKEHAVRVLDANGNLRIGDRSEPVADEGRMYGLSQGDKVQIDLGDGSFADTRTVDVGHLEEIAGQWYRLDVDAAGMKVKAVKIAVTPGRIKIDHKEWRGVLLGQEQVLRIEGTSAERDVPAGQYVMVDYVEFGPGQGQGQKPALHRRGYRALAEKKLPAIEVTAGKTTPVAVGSPLKGVVGAAVRGSKVLLSLEVLDTGGTAVDYVFGADGNRWPQPVVAVSDGSGKEVYRCTLEYG